MTESSISSEDDGHASAAGLWLRSALDSSLQFRREFLTESDWVVIPVESGPHFSREDADRISRAMAFVRKVDVQAVLLEELVDVRDEVTFEATTEGLCDFNKEFAHFNVALVPEDFSFAIICTVNDHFLIGGHPDFVSLAVGKPLPDARTEFLEYARSEQATVKQFLLEIASRYDDSSQA